MEIHFNLLFQPFPLFPMYAGYCNGEITYVLSTFYRLVFRTSLSSRSASAEVTGKKLLSISLNENFFEELTAFFVGQVPAAIAIALLRRLQILLPDTSILKLRQV